MPSISFDRAANFYDETRGFPPGIGDMVAEAALELMPPNPHIVEVGVGTGRIARPLLARGARLTGVDLSPKMMARLLETLPDTSPRPILIEGDATHLPLATRAFDVALSVHVFHLIANWQQALAEVRRVLAPGGILLTGYDHRPPDSPGDRMGKKWREIIHARGIHNQPGAHDFADVDAALRATGATMTERSVGEWTRTRTLAQHLESVEHRTWSSSWGVPDNFFPDCLTELRAWAVGEFGPAETEFVTPHTFVWQCYRWE